jgi:hypothetical protein
MKTSEKADEIIKHLDYWENYLPYSIWIRVIDNLLENHHIKKEMDSKLMILYKQSEHKGSYDKNNKLVLMVNLIYNILFKK